MEKIEINALGKPCPLPVIETKKAIAGLADKTGEVDVLVDNEVAVENIHKMAQKMNYQFSSEQKEENFLIKLLVSAAEEQKSEQNLVILIGRKTMGEGAVELGEILLKGYFYSLTELPTPPQQLLFFNEGAFLTCEGSDILKDLALLKDKGTEISTCGTCLDYYDMKDKLAIGDVTNMYSITETAANAKKVMTL